MTAPTLAERGRRRARDARWRAQHLAQHLARSAEARVSRRLGVFCYHQVGPTGADPWDLAVSPGHFDEQLDVLSRSGRLVGLDDIVAVPRRERAGRTRRLHAITFDDGYVDNLRTALPALERYDAPVTVFVPTGFLDTAAFWWDRVAALALSDERQLVPVTHAACTVGLFDQQRLHEAVEWTPALLHDELYRAVHRHDDIDGVLDAVESLLPDAPRPHQRPITVEELVELAAHPLVDIGGHTVSHPSLPLLDGEAVAVEIRTGLDRLEEILGRRPRSFA